MMNWMTVRAAGLAGTMLLACQAASAQTTAADALISTSNDTIVVSGKRDPAPKPAEVHQQARSITNSPELFQTAPPLFQKKVCPGVSGLPVDLAEYVADRIRFNAERAGLELGKAGECRANLIVAFVLDGRKVLNDYDKQGHSILVRMANFDRKQMLKDPGPVHAFVLSRHVTRDGKPLKRDPNLGYEVLETQSSNSLFLLNSRTDIDGSVVVIDIPAIDGLSAKQIADYATMRGLADTRPVTGEATYGTILNLFDPDAGHPAELTTFDLGYLRALYHNAPNLSAMSKIGGIAGEMRKQLAAASAAKESDN
jgi:hypothetical protein